MWLVSGCDSEHIITVLAAKLIPVTFTVNNASPTSVGDYIFLTGNTIELSNWNTTWDGAVTWENGANHSYTVPTSGTGFVNVNWQY